MKYLLTILLMLASVMLYAQKIPARPSPPKLVNDYVNLLTHDQAADLERRLVAYDDSTSIQIAIVIVATLDDYEPVDYAVKLGRDWGVGNKKTNNGVVILISTEPERPEKRKVFIAPGYGLEGAIPDITAKQIVENEIIPQLRQGNYYRALVSGTDAIIEASRGEYKAPAGYHKKKSKGGGGAVGFFIILLIVVLILSRGGGPKGGMMSRRGVGFLPFIFPMGGGGGSSGWGGGGGGGGGFGGFGGGSFGGGGAGGSW
jgi:uncharacterized protein